MSEEKDYSYLTGLNPPQHEGVINTEGPCMIIAGAGSGKTRVLTLRITHLIRSQNIDPFSILALTFTNKASSEMRSRIEKYIGTDARNIWMGTFHSVFARILRGEAHHLGYPSDFTIYDTDDSKSLIKNIVKEMGLDDKVYKANVVYNRISGAKNRLVSWQSYVNNPIYAADDESNGKPHMGKIYKTYVERCFKADAMDFDDLLFNTNVLFRDHVDVLNKYQQRFKYVLVDEFQDTNISQYLITKRLASVRENICVVGDDAQSIYAFRGADIQNILNFEKDYPDLRVIKLEQNYRSSQTIVNAANSVIKHNSAQLHKDVWTSNGVGDPIKLIKASSDNEEGKLVASTIFEEKSNHKLKNSDFVVLYRTNSQSRAIEEALRKNNLPYKIIGGLSFYQRREIKDILGYIRFMVNGNDEQALRRIINLPKRGIGAATMDKIVVWADQENTDIWGIMSNIGKYMSGRVANSISDFVTMIKSFRILMETKDAFEIASHVAKHSGLLKELYADKTIEGVNRYENVQELLSAIQEFVDNSETKDIGAFLQDVALLTSQDQDDDEEERVTLMTIHMAKGLEFKQVFIVGLEEDLFPSQMMLSSREDLEEERRLFYVAMTRAEQKLYLSYALSRYRFGRLKSCEPSRFIEEVDSSLIQPMSKKWAGSDKSVSSPAAKYMTSNFVKSMQSTNKNQRSYVRQKAYKPSADFTPSDTSNLKVGMKVEHPQFGFGAVSKMDVEGQNRKAIVDFDKAGAKTLLLQYAKLRIIE